MKKTLIIFLCFLFLVINLYAKTLKNYTSQFGFIENKGQIIDQNNNPNPSVKYLWTGNGMKVQLKANSFSYEILKIEKFQKRNFASQERSSKSKIPNSNLKHGNTNTQNNDSTLIYSHRIDIELIGANPNPELKAERQRKDYINYYTAGTPEDGVTYVHQYQKVTYQDIYHNIDLEFILDASNKQPFKYNFIVHPSGRVSDIQLKYIGAKSTELIASSCMNIATPLGDLQEKIPNSFIAETGENIAVQYQQNLKNVFGFNAGIYNGHQTLIIDPWASYYGGNSDDVSFNCISDSFGNVYAVGYTLSNSNIATVGAFQTTTPLNGKSDGFMVKFNLSGVRQWGTYYGGNGDDDIHGIAIDKVNNLLISGNTHSATNIATTGAFQPNLGYSSYGGMLLKFTTSGIRLWGTYIGDSTEIYDPIVAIDTSNNIYITGFDNGVNCGNFITSGAYQTIPGNDYTGFLAKYTSTGNRVWTTFYGGSNSQSNNPYTAPGAISVDDTGNIYIAGTTNSLNNISTSNSFQPNYGGAINQYEEYDAFLAKFSNSGILIWGTYYGGNHTDGGGVFLCKDGTLLLSGGTGSSNLSTSGTYQLTKSSGHDGFVAKFNAAGNRLWGTYYGGNGDDGCMAITDNANNIILCGITTSTSGISSIGSYQSNLGGGEDVFIAKLDSNGTSRAWGTYYGGLGDDYLSYGKTDLFGNIIVSGYTNSTSNIATTNAHQTVYGGGIRDAFVAVFDNNGTLNPTPAITGNSVNAAQAVCSSVQPALLTGSSPSGGSGSFGYLWLQSTTSATSGFTAASGTNNTQNYQPPVLSATTWYKRIVMSGSNADTTAAIQITVNAAPVASITSGGNTTFCQGGNVILDANTGSGLSYQWQNNNANINGATNANYMATTSGVYQIVISANGCSATSNTITVTVNPIPTANVTAGGNTIFCQGGNVILNANTGTGLNYQWQNNNVNINGETNATYFATTTGVYQVVIAANGCSATSNTITVTVNPVPIANVTASGATSFCQGGSLNLGANTGTGLSYQWYNGSTAISGASNSGYVDTTSGSFTVIVTNSSNCSDTSTAVTVTVNPLPTVTITQNTTTLNSSGSFNSYQWYYNNTAISGATNANYNPTLTGNYYLVVTDGNNCNGQSNVLSFVVGVEEMNGGHLLSVSPNPFKESFEVSCPAAKGTITVTDIVGKVFVTLSLSKGFGAGFDKLSLTKTTIDMKGYSSGVYLVKYENEGIVETVKVVKE